MMKESAPTTEPTWLTTPVDLGACIVAAIVRAMATAGDAPRSRRILRLIALERSARGLLLLAAGAYLITHLGSDVGRVADHAMRAVELDPKRPFLHRIISKLHRLHARTLLVTGIAATGYVFAATVFWIFCFSMSRYSQFMERRLATGHKR